MAVLNAGYNYCGRKIEPGAHGVVGEGDGVILKAITPSSLSTFDALIAQARQQAAEARLEPDDIADAIQKARAKT